MNRILTAEKFADALSVHPKTLHKIEGRFPDEFPCGFYDGRRRKWRESDVSEFLDVYAASCVPATGDARQDRVALAQKANGMRGTMRGTT